MKLYNVIKQLILEASTDDITNSIRNRNVVTIYYDGDEENQFSGKGLRIIEPFCYGKTKKGNMAIRAWEREGASFTGAKGEQPLPGWRLFRVDRIGNYSVNPKDTFDTQRPRYNPDDKGMVGLKICAKFNTE